MIYFRLYQLQVDQLNEQTDHDLPEHKYAGTNQCLHLKKENTKLRETSRS